MTPSTAGTPPATDLTVAAALLKQAASAILNGTTAYDPTPCEPLAPHLAEAADLAQHGYGYVAIPVSALAEFARRLLGEEEDSSD